MYQALSDTYVVVIKPGAQICMETRNLPLLKCITKSLHLTQVEIINSAFLSANADKIKYFFITIFFLLISPLTLLIT
jgi:hypothetical protein